VRHLLVDGKNALYRALFAARSDKEFITSGRNPFVIFIHFLCFYLQKLKPSAIHIFWDDEAENLWRKKLYPEYKLGRINERAKHGFNVEKEMFRMELIAQLITPHMGIRNYHRDEMEADDLIYAFVKASNEKVVIVSSDSDFLQLSDDRITVYNPMNPNKKGAAQPVMMKCLMGDKTDNISGYYGIGPKRASMLCEEPDILLNFLKKRGPEKFISNLKLIDLSRCPDVLNNVRYILSVRHEDVKFDAKAIENIATIIKVNGLISDMHRYVLPFKVLNG
jgi:5'-3' exonuclease